MLSKRYVPTQIQNLAYEESLTRHYKKLDEITKVDAKRKKGEKEFVEKTKYSETREKTIKFHINERTQAIEKDNELLLGRLVEISRKKPKLLMQIKSESTLPRTLNGPSRRREKDRIAAENEAFARRLLSQQPSFNPKKLEYDYEKHNQRVKNMQKITNFSPRKFRLPPLKHDSDPIKDSKNKSVIKRADKKKSVEELQDAGARTKSEGDEETLANENVEDTKEENGENNQDNAVDREAAERAAKETAEREAKEAAEKAAKEKEAADQVAKEEAEKAAKEKEVADQAAREAAEKVAKENEAAEQATKEAAEKAAKEAAEKAAKEAAEKEAAEKAVKEAAENEAQDKAQEAATQENKENKDKPASQKEVQPPAEQTN